MNEVAVASIDGHGVYVTGISSAGTVTQDSQVASSDDIELAARPTPAAGTTRESPYKSRSWRWSVPATKPAERVFLNAAGCSAYLSPPPRNRRARSPVRRAPGRRGAAHIGRRNDADGARRAPPLKASGRGRRAATKSHPEPLEIGSGDASWISNTIDFIDVALPQEVAHTRFEWWGHRERTTGQVTLRTTFSDELRPEATWL